MQAILQSSFLQALSHSLIASIWQMAMIWTVTIVILKLFRLSSAQKFILAFLAQTVGFALFVFTCFRWCNNPPTTFLSTQVGFTSNISSTITALMPYMALLYVTVLLIKIVKLVFIYNNSQLLRKQELQKISPNSRVFVQEMSELFSLHRKVKIYLSGKITCPLTTGFLKPVILIPFAAVNHLTTEQMEAVILHELAHIKRADYLLFILQSIIEKIFFFNIFSTMLGDIIERERENACDDWVLQFRYNSMHYAEALFKLGKLKATPALAMHFSGKKESLLLMRVKRLLHNTQHQNALSLQPVLFGLLSMVVAAGFLISPAKHESVTNTAVSFIAVKGRTTKTSLTLAALAPLSTKIDAVKTKNESNNNNKPSTTQSSSAPLQTSKVKRTVAESSDASVATEDFNKDITLSKSYIYKVNQTLDSIDQILPSTYQKAVNAQVVVTPGVLQKAMSYQNFKQIENMLAASGNSISVTESESSKDSYRKLLTIEATDKDGNKHVYNVIVELYQ